MQSIRFKKQVIRGEIVPAMVAQGIRNPLAFGKEERLQTLSGTPSEILRRQLRVTPYPHEDVRWIMENSGEDMVLFSSDFPHVEGGRNPLKRFNENLAGVDERLKRKFYRDNFIDLMGNGLARDLHDLPSLAAA